jgi:S1/P1 Nuclease
MKVSIEFRWAHGQTPRLSPAKIFRMRFPRQFAAFVITLLLAVPACPWDATGHRTVAAIAYDRLTPKARAKVDELIRQHPDYATLFIARAVPVATADSAVQARDAFLTASIWPDALYSDKRFYDPRRAGDVPTSLLPGFPDMERHATWHYDDIPLTPDGAKAPPHDPQNALSELRRILANIAAEPSAQEAYDLPWLVHLVGDVHQPLHATSRYLKSQPKGDAGGNRVFVGPSMTGQASINLHAYWDDAVGTDTSGDYVNRLAASITAEYPKPSSLSTNPNRWLKESFNIDKSFVYSFGLGTGTKERPVSLPKGYRERAQRIARQRIALAGYRLAAVLNERFR